MGSLGARNMVYVSPEWKVRLCLMLRSPSRLPFDNWNLRPAVGLDLEGAMIRHTAQHGHIMGPFPGERCYSRGRQKKLGLICLGVASIVRRSLALRLDLRLPCQCCGAVGSRE